MKKVLSLFLILLLLLSLAACGAKKEETKEAQQENAVEEYPGLSADPEILTQDKVDPDRVVAETMTRDCIDAMLVPDFKTVFDMLHPDIVAYSRRQKNINDAQYAAMIDNYNTKTQADIDELGSMCDTWSFEVEVLDFEDMTTARLNSLSESYMELGIRVDDGIEVTVQLYIIADGVKIPLRKMVFAYIQCDEQWYLQNSLTGLVRETTTS